MSPPLYEIKTIPGKGRGLVASADTAKGTRILSEQPFFTLASAVTSIESEVMAKIKTLSKEQQRQYIGLHYTHPGKNVFNGIFRTSALPCGVDSKYGAVYPTICLVNHACDPNAHHSWNKATHSETIHALCDIKAGEEITISYNQKEIASIRQAKLKSLFGFDCECNLCSLPPFEIRQSDAHRIRIEQLDEAIGDSASVMNTTALADCREMLSLLQGEYHDRASPLDARLYYDAFQIAITHGDQARASVFAERGYMPWPESSAKERIAPRPQG